nr:DUF3221 domain-containing protein [Halobacillus sp. A5]
MLCLIGCSTETSSYSDEPTIEGYIIEADTNTIVVAEGMTKEEAMASNPIDVSDDVYVHRFKEEGWFPQTADYKEGQKVKVWGEGGAMESYPPQSVLGKIEQVK